ncbi:NADP-dependent oxidoreductase [Kribbella monticola]|uniref:NADP-dependent oxidoreductase n=1 Tax=Kribbella monticola TaxID=2185285 RepID=UPI001E55DB72|nr:NADP-dependent oxidoreductase [Kribbella monticola]
MTEIQLVGRPTGVPTADLFAFVDSEPPVVQPGTALVENLYLSVDPYMRQCMDELWELHSPLEGRSLGRVVESRTPEYEVGDIVFHGNGWRTHALVRPGESRRIEEIPGVPLSAHLGILGGTGLSAYVGLVRVAKLQPGETVFVSAAAGAVGTAAARLAKLLGAGRVIGSTGSREKAERLVSEVGFDAAFCYRDGPIVDSLAKAAPDGIDVYLDNVGGEHLAAAIDVLKQRGRIAWCGAVSTYNHEAPVAPRNLFDIVGKELRLEGFLVRENLDARPELYDLVVPELLAGRMVSDETVVTGFDSMVEAFLAMLSGANRGKMIVRL